MCHNTYTVRLSDISGTYVCTYNLSVLSADGDVNNVAQLSKHFEQLQQQQIEERNNFFEFFYQFLCN